MTLLGYVCLLKSCLRRDLAGSGESVRVTGGEVSHGLSPLPPLPAFFHSPVCPIFDTQPQILELNLILWTLVLLKMPILIIRTLKDQKERQEVLPGGDPEKGLFCWGGQVYQGMCLCEWKNLGMGWAESVEPGKGWLGTMVVVWEDGWVYPVNVLGFACV